MSSSGRFCLARLLSVHCLLDKNLRAEPSSDPNRWRGPGLGGPRGKGSPSVSRGPKPPIQLLQLLKNSPREVKGPIFVIYWVPPGPTQEMELMGPGGEGPSRSTPVSPAMPSPPPPTSDRTTREIDANPRSFSCSKKWGRFTGFAPTFYIHRRYGGHSLVLRLRKKRELWKLLKELHGRPSVKLRGPLGSFSPGIGPLKHNIFILFLNVNLGPLPENSGPNPMSFQFLTGVRLI